MFRLPGVLTASLLGNRYLLDAPTAEVFSRRRNVSRSGNFRAAHYIYRRFDIASGSFFYKSKTVAISNRDCLFMDILDRRSALRFR